MKITITPDMLRLVRMIEVQETEYSECFLRGRESNESIATLYALRTMQAELSDLTIEAIRHEVPV